MSKPLPFQALLKQLSPDQIFEKRRSKKSSILLFAPNSVPESSRVNCIKIYDEDPTCVPLWLRSHDEAFSITLIDPSGAAPSEEGVGSPFHAPYWLMRLFNFHQAHFGHYVSALDRIPFTAGDESIRKANCAVVLDDHLNRFALSRENYFPTRRAWIEWESWSRAKRWIGGSVSAEVACKQLGVDGDDGATQEMRDVLGSCRQETADLDFSAGDWIDAPSPVKRTDTFTWHVMKPYVEREPFGGPRTLVYPRHSQSRFLYELPPFEKDRRKRTVPHELWWWRSLIGGDRTGKFPQWADELKQQFSQNWETSAFWYEFRVRTRRKEQPWFGLPWIELDHIARGVLRILWPPTVHGRHTIVPRLPPPISEFLESPQIEIRMDVDLSKTADDTVLAEVKQMLTRERDRRNLPPSGKGKNRTPVYGERKWGLLEALDEAFYTDIVSREYDSLKSKLEKSYREACELAGVKPGERTGRGR